MGETKTEFVARRLRENLGPPGSDVSSESTVMKTYDVSRGTARRALALLESEGLVTAAQGQPRRVREVSRKRWNVSTWEVPSQHSIEADAWANAVKDQGGRPHTDVVVTIVNATQSVADALGCETGEPIVCRSRVRYVDNEPHQLSDSYFPRQITDDAPDLLTPGDQHVPGGLLAANGHPQVRLDDEITARMPTAEESRQLNMPTGTALLVHHRTGFDASDRPVRLMITRMPADRAVATTSRWI